MWSPKGRTWGNSPDLQQGCGLRSLLCVEQAGDNLHATLTQNVWGKGVPLVTPNLKVKPAAPILLKPDASQNSNKCQLWSPPSPHAPEAAGEEAEVEGKTVPEGGEG